MPSRTSSIVPICLAVALVAAACSSSGSSGDDAELAIPETNTERADAECADVGTMPADPDLSAVEVAQEFSERYGDSDVAGFLGLMSPDAEFITHDGRTLTYSPGVTCEGEVGEARYLAATGGSATVECVELTGDADAQCDLLITNVFIDRRGGPSGIEYRFTVEDGFVTSRRVSGPPYFLGSASDPTVESEVAEYAAWLRENHADEADELVTRADVLVVGTEEARARHRTLINAWLAGLD